MGGYSGAHHWQGFGKFYEPPKLLGFLPSYVVFVIEILQPSSSVFPYGLHGASGCRVDPHVSPSRRNLQILDSFSIRGVYLCAVSTLISEAPCERSTAIYSCFLKSFEFCH